MGLLDKIGSGVSGLGGLGAGIAGGMGGTTTTKGTNTTNGTSSQNGTFNTTPVFDPATEGLRQQLIKSVLGNLGTDTDMSGYLSGALQTNNQGFDAAKTALGQTLAQRGLTYSPVSGAAMGNLDTQRIGAGIGIQNQIPLLQQQMYQQKLQQALQTFGAMPYGQSGTSSQNGATSQTQNVDMSQTTKPSGGIFGGIMEGLGALGGMIPGL